MNLGINQIILLKRCKDKGWINISDVYIVYSFPENPRPRNNSRINELKRKAKIILEKLEIPGLLEKYKDPYYDHPQNPVYKWKLTNQGEIFLDEYFKKIKTGRS